MIIIFFGFWKLRNTETHLIFLFIFTCCTSSIRPWAVLINVSAVHAQYFQQVFHITTFWQSLACTVYCIHKCKTVARGERERKKKRWCMQKMLHPKIVRSVILIAIPHTILSLLILFYVKQKMDKCILSLVLFDILCWFKQVCAVDNWLCIYYLCLLMMKVHKHKWWLARLRKYSAIGFLYLLNTNSHWNEWWVVSLERDYPIFNFHSTWVEMCYG